MRFRLKAFGLHLAASAGALTLVIGGIYLGWYRWPGWYLTGVVHILLLVLMVDLVLGPTLTLVVANPGKPRRQLTRDVAIIAAVQVAALAYGATTLWQGRPLYYTFSFNRLETVAAWDLHAGEVARGRRENPDLAPHWYSRPRWVWAPLPADPNEAIRIMKSTSLEGGDDVIDMPRLFKPWTDGLSGLREKLSPVADIRYFSKKETATLSARIAALGLPPEERNAMVMWGVGGDRRLLAVFDTKTTSLRALLRCD